MAGELLFTVQPGEARPAEQVSLAEAGLRERSDLQEWVRKNPEILGDGVRVVTFEFDAWWSTRGREADRLDLLGLDRDGYLLLAELKRGPAPDTVEMQAIKYAAFASRFTVETLAERHAEYLSKMRGERVSDDEARERLEEHVGEELDPAQLRRPRIALLAESFPPQVTASAVWLTEMGLDISLVEFKAYRHRARSRSGHLPDLAARRCRGLHRRASRVRAARIHRARTDAPPGTHGRNTGRGKSDRGRDAPGTCYRSRTFRLS